MTTRRYRLAILIPLLSAGTCSAQVLYKSVDAQGRVTYSEHPVAGAVKTEGVPIAPGPSPEEAERAKARVQAIEEAADTEYQELMERRKQEAEAREEAERQRAEREAREAFERQRYADDGTYIRSYPYGWRWPYPHPPIHPPIPPRPIRPGRPPNRPYEDHINPPTRNR